MKKKRAAPTAYSISDMQNIAKKRKGKCLSKKYVNSITKLEWQCKKGHHWEAKPANVIHRNSWCPVCGNAQAAKKNTKYSIQDMMKVAKSNRGKCLSKKYTHINNKLHWECKKGHRWYADPTRVFNGSWCQKCYLGVPSIADMQKLAKKKKGKCLSKTYKGSRVKMKWECKEGHQWHAISTSIVCGSWCPMCARKRV